MLWFKPNLFYTKKETRKKIIYIIYLILSDFNFSYFSFSTVNFFFFKFFWGVLFNALCEGKNYRANK